jgi:hypothetical protein
MTSPISVSVTMVPLQAIVGQLHPLTFWWKSHTELLLDDLQDLLLVEFLRETLDRSQRLTSIAFCENDVRSAQLVGTFSPIRLKV